MVTTQAAKLMNLPDYGITVGSPADIVVLDCEDALPRSRNWRSRYSG